MILFQTIETDKTVELGDRGKVMSQKANKL